MKVAVIGAGLIGITTAYCLRRRGCEVVLLERAAGAGLETSFANGAILTPGMSDPWNAPGCWRVMLRSLVRSDSPLQVRLTRLPSLVRWGVAFLRNSSPRAFERNTLSNLKLGLYSLDVMEELRRHTNIEYSRAARGTLKIFRDTAALERVVMVTERLAERGLKARRLSVEQTIELEPTLAPIAGELAGSIHYENDETGDAYEYCVALAQAAEGEGVEIRYRTPVVSLHVLGKRLTGVVTDCERIEADQYVVAAGSYSTPLLRSVGVRLPVQPAKGYSVSVDRQMAGIPLAIPIVDDALHAVITPVGGVLRAAGTAEFAGFDCSPNVARSRNLLHLMRTVFPRGRFDEASASYWCGLRPMSADGVPIVGPTAIDNLFVNTGHGHLGWTLAAGSAQLLTDLLCGVTPAIETHAYDPRRFG